MKHTEGKLFVSSLTLILNKEARIVADLIPVGVPGLAISMEDAVENAQDLVRCWNAFNKGGLVDKLLDACKEIDHFFNESVGQILTSKQALKSYHDSNTSDRIKQAIASAEGGG